MTAAFELPEVYERYQEFLPEFSVAISLVLSKLAIVYENFIEKGGTIQVDDTIQMWLEQYDDADSACDASQSHYTSLREIIDEMFSDTGVSYKNEAFLDKVRIECEDYGYESWEDPVEIYVEEVYSVRLALLNEVQYFVGFLDTCELLNRIMD